MRVYEVHREISYWYCKAIPYIGRWICFNACNKLSCKRKSAGSTLLFLFLEDMLIFINLNPCFSLIFLCALLTYNGINFLKSTQLNCFRDLNLGLPHEALDYSIMVHQYSEFGSIGYMDFASGINLIAPWCTKQNWFELLRYKRKWKSYWVISAVKYWIIR